MKKILLILFLSILILPMARASLIIEAFQIPSNVQEGDTFETSVTLKNTGPETIGSSLSPVIATLSSVENCIINSAKIVGILNPGETKDVSWVVTAPTAGGCQIAISVSASGVYASDSKSVTVSSDQESSTSGGSSGSGGGAASGGGTAGGAGGGAGGSAETATTLEPGSVPEENEIEETTQTTSENTYEETGDVTREMPWILLIIVSVIIIILLLILYFFLKRKH